ncbi:peptidoglycan -binding protein [Meridianimarinicoccus sp. RP-17]|uniref:peptidoglycan -binding protein n=1 Tax=Meridianimarinicoccus zhengii TaxID=2056810 RepID=UPI000DAE9E6B|nr:peptidoglycan -binding protein [Phycocomes zhengii]
MALNRRSGQRFQASIWPGFVDAMTALLLVLIFVLTIFMVVQSILTETISGQETELDALQREVGELASALGVEQQRNFELEQDVDALGNDLARARDNEAFQNRLIDTLSAELDRTDAALADARAQITDFEARVATLLTDRDAARDRAAELGETLASTREALDAEQEAAQLAEAQRAALEAMVAEIRAEQADTDAALAEVQAELDDTAEALSAEEAARLAEAEAARRLRARLESADAELTAMTLRLEQERARAEETLTLLAAARDAQEDLDERLMAALADGDATEEALAAARAELDAARDRLAEEGATAADLRARLADALAARQQAEAGTADAMLEAERQARLLAQARDELSEAEESSAADRRRIAALTAQIDALRGQLADVQALLDDAEARDAVADVQIEALGQRLNAALARVATEERRRAELEAAERARLEEEARRLENYRSEFFGRLREILGDQDGVQVVGDRFVFSSEVLFASGSADLSPEGEAEVANVARRLQEVAAVIPEGIDWVIRVDGHTDDVPVSTSSEFADNWELSQARALSVVRYMVDNFGFPPNRLAATGFAEFQPVDPRDTPEARARNRRIELKLTER